MKFLFTAGGRRVELIELFRQYLSDDDDVMVADVVNTAPALYAADAIVIPSMKEEGCVDKIIQLCQEKKVNIILPLIDPEISFYAQHRLKFLEAGIQLSVSHDDAVKVAQDKWETFLFFQSHKIPTPQTWNNRQGVDTFPIIAKPRFGSSGLGVLKINNATDLMAHPDIEENYIFQQYINGDEVTVDVVGDGKGSLLGSAQRLRLKSRGGEVERSVTIHDNVIQKHIEKVTTLLKPLGVINIQFFKTHDGQIFFHEINLRLGGGVPLTIRAGVNVPQLLKEVFSSSENIKSQYAQDGVYMLRYDKAVYLNKEELIRG